MKQNSSVVMLIIAAIILGAIFGMIYGDSFDSSNEEAQKEAFDQAFRKSCLDSVGTKNNALAYCNCAIDILHNENSFSKLKEMAKDSLESKKPSDEVVDAFTRCAETFPLS